MKKTLLLLAFVCMAVMVQAQSLSRNTLEVCFKSAHAADSIIRKNPGMRFERVIPRATNPVIEERHRRAGLDLWYVAEVDTKKQITEQVNRFKAMPQVKTVAPTTFTEYKSDPIAADMNFDAPAPSKAPASRAAESPVVNDPLYYMQWHYANDDYAHINLEKAWQIEQGKRNVIVAVMDGFIDYTHPDLAQNIWINEAEKNGQPGVDDDGNGYVDDIYGLNFWEAEEGFADHGTHIAGTIAAVNNNGIGVCGIAGGDGVNTGVRVMSVAITSPTGKGFVPNWLEARAYVYAADNGAVISSNSWGQENELPSAILSEGIQYFMKYAGNYEGSPMKGGLVLFAAGNDYKDTPDNPFNDPQLQGDNFIIVGATASNGLHSTFSNYGPWIDIVAPGGEWNGRGIYSTYPDNKYGFMNGTSMATPHVSGVAALVVSKFASPSLTPGWVKKKLQNSASPIDPIQAGHPFAGQMGAGLLDAYRAVCAPAEAPGVPTDFKVTRSSENLTFLTWKVPAEADGNPVSKCIIYPDDSKIPIARVQTIGTPVGEVFNYCLFKNEAGTSSQSYRIRSVDVMGNESEMSAPVDVQAATELEVVNPYNRTNFLLYRPFYVERYRKDQTCLLEFPIMLPENVYTFASVSDPNNIIKNVFVKQARETSRIFMDIKTKADTPLGTFPFTVSCYYGDNPDKKYTLNLTYTVEDSLRNNRGVIPIDEERMHYRTSDVAGKLEIPLRDYIRDAFGLDFVIIDCEPQNLFDAIYSISNDILKVDFDFSDSLAGGENDITVSIPITAYNTYFDSTESNFYIHYVEPTGIKSITSEAQPSTIYTPAGIRVNSRKADLAPGMYIMDGKKVIIR